MTTHASFYKWTALKHIVELNRESNTYNGSLFKYQSPARINNLAKQRRVHILHVRIFILPY